MLRSVTYDLTFRSQVANACFKMPAKTKLVKRVESSVDRRERCPHGNRIMPGTDGPCGCRVISAQARKRPPDEPCLDWEKQSDKRYAAIVPGAGAEIEVVRSGCAGYMNERWHPLVFGNRWAGPGDGFESLTEAQVFAETTASGYARIVLELLR